VLEPRQQPIDVSVGEPAHRPEEISTFRNVRRHGVEAAQESLHAVVDLQIGFRYAHQFDQEGETLGMLPVHRVDFAMAEKCLERRIEVGFFERDVRAGLTIEVLRGRAHAGGIARSQALPQPVQTLPEQGVVFPECFEEATPIDLRHDALHCPIRLSAMAD